jgi:aminopeptidase YwaD
MKRYIIFLLTALIAHHGYAQVITAVTADTLIIKKHISILASDEMEGRETGTEGEKRAYEYISSEFRKLGLLPKGTSGYIQPFEFNAGSELGSNNLLEINNHKFKAPEDFYPLPYSANGNFAGGIALVGHGISAPGIDDYASAESLSGKVFIMESGYPAGMDPHSKMAELADLRTRIDSAIARGASAVIFINSDKNTENPPLKFSIRITPFSIPVLFVTSHVAELFLKKDLQVKGSVEIIKTVKTGNNIVGYLDNGGKYTVVIGAHYDHLGYGIEASLYRGEKKEIHNGADDNASGVAALIELARLLKGGGNKHFNYLFIAFSGEEMGLLGSNNLVKNFPIPLEKVNYMLNMDMVGRIKNENPVLLINGTGTSPIWKETLEKINCPGITYKTTESGVGPSDHTSFYLKDIPVLHFFSGTHSDYHKPTDDEQLINYTGMYYIVNCIYQLIEQLENYEKLAFTKTNDSSNEETPRFKVTLGVVPDYAFEGEGMRIDGISDNKPAQKAGLQPGDVVIQLGDIHVNDMMSYMKALGKFSKGETTKVSVKRGSEIIIKDITF